MLLPVSVPFQPQKLPLADAPGVQARSPKWSDGLVQVLPSVHSSLPSLLSMVLPSLKSLASVPEALYSPLTERVPVLFDVAVKVAPPVL